MSATLSQSNVFIPTQISGCSFWIDAADTTAYTSNASGIITNVRDKSGNGKNLTNNLTTNGFRRLTTFNGSYPSFFYNDTQNVTLGSNSSFSLSQPATIFAVHRTVGGGSFQDPFDSTTNGSRFFAYYELSVSKYNTFAGLVLTQTIGTFASGGGVYSHYFNGANSEIFQNGTTIASGNAGSQNCAGITIGSRFTQVNETWQGHIAEVIYYSGRLSLAQRQQVEGYLAWKWGFQGSLPATHPYKNSPFLGLPSAPVPLSPPQIYSAGFNPTQISGCQLWLDAADTSTINLSGSSVISVKDKAQNIIFTTQGTPSLLTVTNAINSRKTLSFNNSAGNSVYLQGTFQNLLTGSVFFVWQAATQLSLAYRAFYAWQSLGGLNFPVFGYINNSTTNVQPYTTFIGPGTPVTSVSAGTNYLTFYGWSGTTTNVGFNGTAPTAGTTGAYSSSSSVFTIMGELDGSIDTVNGYIGEMIFYNSVLSTTQRQEVEGYLAWKWGLQANLPANHPYKNSPFLGVPSAPNPVSPPQLKSASWLPIQISNLNAWFDGADPLGTGKLPRFNTTLSTWFDKSGNGRNASGGSSATFVSGGVSFGGTNWYSMSIPYSSNYSIFLVATNTSIPETYFFARSAVGAGLPTFIQGYIGAGIGLEWFEGSDRATIATTPVSPFMASVDHIQGTNIVGWYYGNQSFNIAQTIAYNGASWNTLGQSSANVNYYGGIMKELIFYSNAVTPSQRQNIEGYLAWKWGLVGNLPANHPYKKWPPSP